MITVGGLRRTGYEISQAIAPTWESRRAEIEEVAAERNPFFALVAMSLGRRGHIPPPDPEGAGIFSMASDERTTALLEAAGFEEVRTDEVKARFSFDDVDGYLAFIGDTAGPTALALRGLNEKQRAEISDDLAKAAAAFATDDGYVLAGVSLAAVAR